MSSLEKDRSAARVMECWVAFQESLSSDKRRYPIQQFQAFWASARQYAELTRLDPLIHRGVVGAVNGLLEFLKLERKRVPEDVLRDADRLECLIFGGDAQASKATNLRSIEYAGHENTTSTAAGINDQ
jgi:hypothetical protein